MRQQFAPILVFASFLACSFLAQASVPTALVYDGEGSCKESCAEAAAEIAKSAGFEVHFINANNWQASLLKSAKLWIQPGGVASLVADALTHEQKNELRKWVASGGGYVGFCAGGFLAAKSFYSLPPESRKIETFELLPMTAEPFDAETESEASILPINWLGTQRALYFEGGPFFETPIPSGVEKVGTYGNGKIATVRTSYGKGRVFVTGLHPEAPQKWRAYYHLEDADGSDIDLARQMMVWAAPQSTSTFSRAHRAASLR